MKSNPKQLHITADLSPEEAKRRFFMRVEAKRRIDENGCWIRCPRRRP